MQPPTTAEGGLTEPAPHRPPAFLACGPLKQNTWVFRYVCINMYQLYQNTRGVVLGQPISIIPSPKRYILQYLFQVIHKHTTVLVVRIILYLVYSNTARWGRNYTALARRHTVGGQRQDSLYFSRQFKHTASPSTSRDHVRTTNSETLLANSNSNKKRRDSRLF